MGKQNDSDLGKAEYNSLLSQSNTWAMQSRPSHMSWPELEQAMKEQAALKALETPQQRRTEAEDKVARAELAAAEQMRAEREKERLIDKRLGEPLVRLVERGIERALAFGVPAEWIPAFHA